MSCQTSAPIGSRPGSPTSCRNSRPRDHDHAAACVLPGKRDDVRCLLAGSREGGVATALEELGIAAAQRKRARNDPQLRAAVERGCRQCAHPRAGVAAGGERGQLFEVSFAQRIVDRPAVVRVDERKVDELGALVEVRHTR